MEIEKLKRIIEGALFASGSPLSIDKLGALFADEDRPERACFQEALDALKADYEGRGVMLKEVSSGYRFQVREEVGEWVSRLWEEKPARYSRALLETLALVAYRQPITRGEIEEIRGVSTSSQIMKTLLERDWVRVVGHRDVPGRPAMYATTRAFLDYFNLKSLDELPSLAEIRDLDEINAELDLADPDKKPDEGITESLSNEGSCESEPAEPNHGDPVAREHPSVQVSEQAAESESPSNESNGVSRHTPMEEVLGLDAVESTLAKERSAARAVADTEPTKDPGASSETDPLS